jgi:hypothetical protein
VFRHGPYRFYFFSREEPRRHVHVASPDGEAKFWLEPRIELATSYRLANADLTTIEAIIGERREEISDAWNKHFGS